MIRVLVTGAAGQVGAEVIRALSESDRTTYFAGTRANCNICDCEQLARVFKDFHPDWVINCAAYTAVDKAEDEPEVAACVNAAGVRSLAEMAKAYSAKLIHLSTDYVFSGSHQDHPYQETDPTGPTGTYGVTKLEGELAVAELLSEYYILRVSWVFGQTGQNFVKTICRLLQERVELSIVQDQQGNPTSAKAIANTIVELIDKTMASSAPEELWGTYHYTGQPTTNWFEYAKTIYQIVRRIRPDLDVILNPVSTSDYPTKATRPAYSVLDCSKISNIFQIVPQDWRVEVEELISWIFNQNQF